MNWTTTTVGEVCLSIKTGKTPPTSNQEYFDGDVNWFCPADIGSTQLLFESKRKITQHALEVRKAVLYEKDSLLLTCIGEIGRCGILTTEASSNQQITALKFKDFVDPRYAYYWFVHNKKTLESTANNAVVPILNNQTLRTIRFSYPSLPVQKQIADTLDKADALRRKDQHLLCKYGELAQSIFHEMFGDPERNECGFELKTVDEIAVKVTDGEHSTPQRTAAGIKLLSARNIKNGYLDYDAGVDYISEDEYTRISKRCNPELNDILISCSGTIGRVTAIRTTEKFSLVRSVALLKYDQGKLRPDYLEFFMQTDFFQRAVWRNVNTSTQSNLFTGQIKKLPVLVPPLERQSEFAVLLEKLNKQRLHVSTTKDQSENLFSSLLTTHFS